MTAAILELFPLLAEFLLFSLGSVGLSLVAVYVERFAIAALRTGDPKLGLWAGVMGAVALYFAYLLATDRAASALTALRAELR